MIKLLHAEELARLAGVHKSTILLAIRRGELHASRTVGRSARIAPEDAKAYLEARGKSVPPELDLDVGRASISVLTESSDVLAMVRHATPHGVEFIGSGGLYGNLIAVGSRLPGILVVDLDMVFMNPVALIRALRSAASLRGAHIIAVGLRDDLFGAARTAGASDVIIKIDARTLTDVLHRLAGVSRMRD
ncbi:MAG: helix-turn-helix domain-containing protein [Polyangiales bacterium]